MIMSIPASATNAPSASAAAVTSGQQAAQINPLLRTGKTKGEDHFSFKDVLDIINPLQHIPIINNIYRKVTGDEISNVARIAGDALYGGFVGAAFGMANAVAVNETGDDMGGIAMTKMGLIKSQEDAQTASNDKSKSPDGLSDADLKNMPVVEVHPIAHDDADTAKQITWDQPVSLASAAPAAMPSPKQLNDIVTGGNQPDAATPPAAPLVDPKNQSADPSISKSDIQKNMLANLDKYQAMQRDANPGLIVPKVADQTAAVADASVQPNAAPKNIFTLPAGAATDAVAGEQAAAPAVVKPTSQYMKLRHY
jgi:hypothetical protein